MTDSSLPPANTNNVKLHREHHLQAAVAGRDNAFKDFDWGDRLITWPRDAEPGVIASSSPSDLPWEHVHDTSLPLTRVWGTIMHEVARLGLEHKLPATLISNHQISRGGNDPADWIRVGIDVSEPVVQADAEAFVQRCSETLATHQLHDTIIEVRHSRYWGWLAPQRRW